MAGRMRCELSGKRVLPMRASRRTSLWILYSCSSRCLRPKLLGGARKWTLCSFREARGLMGAVFPGHTGKRTS